MFHPFGLNVHVGELAGEGIALGLLEILTAFLELFQCLIFVERLARFRHHRDVDHFPFVSPHCDNGDAGGFPVLVDNVDVLGSGIF